MPSFKAKLLSEWLGHIVMVAVLPAFLVANVMLISSNYEKVLVWLFWHPWETSVGNLILLAWLYALLVSASAYLYRRMCDQQSRQDLVKQLGVLQAKLDEQNKQLAQMQTATSQVLVPTPLNSLLNKQFDANTFTQEAYRPGLLTAQPQTR